jgi:CRP-like cAMP-binding protein
MIGRRHRPDVSAFAGIGLFDGATLAREACHAHEVVVIVAGEVAVLRGGVAVGRLRTGDVLGAAEEVTGAPHIATYVAESAVSALVLTGPAFRWAVRSLPGFVDRSGVAV